MRKSNLVIAGGGLTAARAITSYREAGGVKELIAEQATRSLPDNLVAAS